MSCFSTWNARMDWGENRKRSGVSMEDDELAKAKFVTRFGMKSTFEVNLTNTLENK